MAVLYPDDQEWRYCEKRKHPIENEDDRGPDSVECSPSSHYEHRTCLLNYTSLRPWGFICGCQCHDPEPSVQEPEHG